MQPAITDLRMRQKPTVTPIVNDCELLEISPRFTTPVAAQRGSVWRAASRIRYGSQRCRLSRPLEIGPPSRKKQLVWQKRSTELWGEQRTNSPGASRLVFDGGGVVGTIKAVLRCTYFIAKRRG